MNWKIIANKISIFPMVGILGLFSAGTAFADLIFSTEITVFGTGLGAVNTLVTVHDPGGPGNNNGTESGCINQNGSFTPCLGIEGGDNTAINNVLTFNTANNFAAVVNISETGQDLTATVTDLYLTFCSTTNPAQCHTASYLGPDLSITQGTGTGLGGSGFTFLLTDAEFAIVQGFAGDNVTVSGGVQFANGSTNDGNDTVHVIQFTPNSNPGPGQEIPEPSTLVLLGSGLVAMVSLTRRFSHRSK
ncbi:MAG: PEP-CTERM sorting domain-containing protein [Deltaproteobacteria bacterium]|nr:MAG: PEP-CTERM sorting domain-containing protein [Deltaproteobacteria bacterium]